MIVKEMFLGHQGERGPTGASGSPGDQGIGFPGLKVSKPFNPHFNVV